MVQAEEGSTNIRNSLCAHLDIITVIAFMRRAVYSDEDIMRNIESAKRYVDDGAGLYNDSVDW